MSNDLFWYVSVDGIVFLPPTSAPMCMFSTLLSAQLLLALVAMEESSV